MRRQVLLIPVTLAVIVAASGCGTGTTSTAASHTPPPTTTTSRSGTPAALEEAVRSAVSENHALLTQALLTNSVPVKPEGTAGPALAAVRSSAAQRKAQGVGVRILSETFRVLAVKLDPTYTTATATILNTQRVQPTYGHRAGAPSTSREHVRLELHRITGTDRFVVWNVTVLR